MIDLMAIDKKAIKDKKLLGTSSNEISRASLTEEGARQAGILSDQAVFTKAISKIQAQEEACFSLIYQLDIGVQASKTGVLTEHRRPVGTISVALNGFKEYWKLYSDSCPYKSEVFNLDENGQPTSFKKVKGLANLLMSAWLYAEDDFHRGNFGIAQETEGELYWARLDFGLSCASITNGSGRPFREVAHHFDKIAFTDLQSFPCLSVSSPFYWPTLQNIYNSGLNISGVMKNSVYSDKDKALFSALADDETFQKEKNAFLLKQFLIDTKHKTDLLTRNVDAPRGQRLATTIESRIFKLRWTGLADSKFRCYIRNLAESKNDLKQIINDVCDNQNSVGGTSSKASSTFCHSQFEHLIELINIIENKRSVEAPLSYFDASMAVLKAENGNKMNALPMVDIHTQQKQRNRAYAALLAKSQGYNAVMQKRLAEIHQTIDKVCVLKPAENIIALCGTKNAHKNLKFLFEQVRDNWLVPCLANANDEENADDLYNVDLLIRIRNIQQLLNEFATKNKLSELKGLCLSFRDVAQQKLSTEMVLTQLTSIEQRLIKLKYEHYFSNDHKNNFNGAKSREEACFYHISQILSHSIEHLLPKFINTCYDKSANLPDIEQSEFVGDITRINIMFKEFLTDNFFTALANGSLSNGVPNKFYKHFDRLNHLFSRYGINDHSTVKPFGELSSQLQQDFMQELSFILARMVLDIQGAQAEEDMKQAPKSSEHTYKPMLLKANKQLSLAMAAPHYHDKESLSMVAEAGILGALALKRPSEQTARQCAEHAAKLSQSHQTRLLTQVAFAVAIVSAITMSLSLIALFGPLGLAAVCASILSVSVETIAVASIATFVTSGSYCAARFFRDKNKVERKLVGVAEATFKELNSINADNAVDMEDDGGELSPI